MAKTYYKDVFKKILVDFIGEEDPILAMLEWTAQRMMEIESEAKVGANKGGTQQRAENIFLRHQGQAHG